MATASKKPSLNVLARFPYLERLYLEGQQKDIEVIAGLKMLEDLTLRSVTAKSLGFLHDLRRLWSLDLKLGGSNDLSALAGMSSLKYLELWQVRGLQDLSPIERTNTRRSCLCDSGGYAMQQASRIYGRWR